MQRIKKTVILLGIFFVLFLTTAYKSDLFEIAKQIEIYTTLFKELNLYYIDDTNPGQLTDTAIKSMLKDLDPYTQFYDEQGVEKARINAAGEFGGIGADVDIINGKLTVIEPFEKGPADNVGIKAGDEILKINDIEVDKNSLEDALFLLNGAPGSEVILEIDQNGSVTTKSVIRDKVEIDPVPYYHMIDNEVGYIAFIKFNTKASMQVRQAFEDLKAKGMQKLILDLRGNPGGLLNEAVEITNFFIPKDEVVVTTRAKVKKWSDTYKTKREPIDLEIPLVVLIDGHSASAAEIVSGSLQDLDRAVIVGERSFGKGLVQRYRSLTYGTQLKLTISKYYTPSGRNIQELDYTHRDENGQVPKFSEKKRNAFKTKNGRTVYDGGGIEPDIKLNLTERTEATKALFESNAIFNYATDYYYKHEQTGNPESFIFSDADYQQFLSALNNGEVSFKTKTEIQFENAIETANTEGYKPQLMPEYLRLIDKAKEEKIQNLQPNKEEIKKRLSDEIVSRYFYKKGEYIYKVYHDKAILEAVSLINDLGRYQKVLQ